MAQDRYGNVSTDRTPVARVAAPGRPSWAWRRAADAVIVLAGLALALPLIVLGG